jgi:hypothetical protein
MSQYNARRSWPQGFDWGRDRRCTAQLLGRTRRPRTAAGTWTGRLTRSGTCHTAQESTYHFTPRCSRSYSRDTSRKVEASSRLIFLAQSRGSARTSRQLVATSKPGGQEHMALGGSGAGLMHVPQLPARAERRPMCIASWYSHIKLRTIDFLSAAGAVEARGTFARWRAVPTVKALVIFVWAWRAVAEHTRVTCSRNYATFLTSKIDCPRRKWAVQCRRTAQWCNCRCPGRCIKSTSYQPARQLPGTAH